MKIPIRLFTSLSFAIFLLAAGPARAQNDAQCPTAPPFNADFAWAPGSQISVFIDGKLSEEAQLFVDALRTWQNHPSNNSRVTFNFVASDPGTVENSLRIVETISPDVLYAETGFDGYVMSQATIRYDPTDVHATATPFQIVVHEIGHTFGLDDCTTCPPGSSVMRTFDDTTEQHLDGPTDCDVAPLPEADSWEYWGDEPEAGSSTDQDNYAVCTHWYLVRYRCYVNGPCVEISRTYLYSECY